MVVRGIGARLLAKMGWSEGTGLGAKRDGPLTPIAVKKRPENLGVGAERRPHQDAWWETMLDDAYGKSKITDPDALFEACEGRRCKPHGSAKLARLEAQEKSVSEEQKDMERDTGIKVLKEQRRDRRDARNTDKGSVSDREKIGRIGKKRRKSKVSKDTKG